jgi:hypothetical protein
LMKSSKVSPVSGRKIWRPLDVRSINNFGCPLG